MRLAGRWLLALALAGWAPAAGQSLSRFERGRGLQMLDVIERDVRQHYFDSTFGGVDLAAAFDSARARVRAAGRVEEMLTAIAQAPLELRDSHTAFIPPGLAYRADYGFETLMVGDTCRVTRVDPASDAAVRGLAVGDAVLAIAGFRITRETRRDLEYLLYLRPQSVLPLVVRQSGGSPRELTVAARVVERRRLVDLRSSIDLWELIRERDRSDEEYAPRMAVLEDRVVVWRIPSFSSAGEWIDAVHKSARRYPAMVLDLRGNGGGYVHALLRLLGGFYAADVQLGTVQSRRAPEPMIARGTGDAHTEAALVVLIDEGSASASEVFARTIQLTGRGRVLGDRSSGLVRTSIVYVHRVGTEMAAYYGAAVAIADLELPDGGRLERVGVTPDELLLPSGADLHGGHDPVLARALAGLGVSISAAEAGRLTWEAHLP